MTLISAGTRCIRILLIAGVTWTSTSSAFAQAPKAKPPMAESPERDAALYCRNTADAAAEARLQWQTWNLISLEAKLQARIADLNRKQAEFEAWVERREKLLSEVEGQVVSIISRMRPDAAAAQLATSEDATAIGVLLKMKARTASEILDEMDPARAAQLTQSMVGFSNNADERSF